MAIQPIDKFCETLDPIVKNAVTIASIGSTIDREKTLAEAYPEENKAEHLRSHPAARARTGQIFKASLCVRHCFCGEFVLPAFLLFGNLSCAQSAQCRQERFTRWRCI